MLPRVIPIMVVDESRCIHTINFIEHCYLGDPINIARIYSELEADELIIFDKSNKLPFHLNGNLQRLIENVNCPITYGIGACSFQTAKNIFRQGVDRIIFKYHEKINKDEMNAIVSSYGSQAIIMCIDFKFPNSTEIDKSLLHSFIQPAIQFGMENQVGEILFQDVCNSGTKQGNRAYQFKSYVDQLGIPVSFGGGVSSLSELKEVFNLGFSGVGVSTLFSKTMNSNTPLISYIDNSVRLELENRFTVWP